MPSSTMRPSADAPTMRSAVWRGLEPVGDEDGDAASGRPPASPGRPAPRWRGRGSAVASSSSRIAGSTRWARARADELALPGRQRPATLAHVVEVAAREPGDEVVGADRPGRRLDLGVARVGPAEGDVVADRPREQERLLRHVAELVPVLGEVEVGQRHAVDQHPPGGGVVEPGDQLHDGRLAGAGLADEGHDLARADLEVDAPQGFVAGAGVREVDVLEPDPPGEAARAAGPARSAPGSTVGVASSSSMRRIDADACW